MEIKRILKYIYISLTLYVFFVIDVTTLTAIDLIPAVILMWIVYLVFSIASSKRQNNVAKNANEKKRKNLFDNKLFILISIILLIVSINYSMNFYVGINIRKFLSLFFSRGYNFYQHYQSHFNEEAIYVFSLNKIPYILMLFYIKIMFITTVIEFFLLRNERKIKHYILIITSVVVHLMFGLSRGTNFEFFELLLLILFIFVNKNKGRKMKITKNHVIFLSLIIVTSIMFYSRIAIRTGTIHFLRRHEYTISTDSIFISIFGEGITGLLFFYDYFIFGFYYTSRFLTEIVFSSIGNLFMVFLPKGHFMSYNIDPKILMMDIAPRRSRWYPNIVNFLINFGFFLTIAYVFIMGIYNKTYNKFYLFSNVLAYIVLLQMFTLPVGDLLFISSSNTLVLIFSLGILLLQKLNIKVFKSNFNYNAGVKYDNY